MITIEPNSRNGFSVWLIEKNPGFTVGFDGWHEEFEDEEDALNAFAFGLSDECRFKVVRRGNTDCAWTVMAKDDRGQWVDDSTTGMLLAPFWLRRKVVYRQNHLINDRKSNT